MVVSTGLMVVSVARWRQRLLKRPERVVPRRLAWALVLGGWVAFLVSYVSLSLFFPDNENHYLITSFGVIIVATSFGILLWRNGFIQESGLKVNRYWIVAVLIFQSVIVAIFIGKVPYIKLAGEVWGLGSAYKQFHDVSSFISIWPERNAHTWMHFFAIWPFLGAYQTLFGVGIFQARFFYLLLGWLATPFIYLTVRRLYGNTAAFFSAFISILIPIHFNWAPHHMWVSTATAIAIYFLVLYLFHSKDRKLCYLFLCGFTSISAVEGHPYGGAFAIMLGIIIFVESLKKDVKQKNIFQPIAIFILGIVCYSAVYFLYHFVVPGVNILELPKILNYTLDWERGLGKATFGVGITYFNVWKMLQLYIFTNIFEFLLFMALVFYMCLSREKEEIVFLILFGGAYILIFSQLAHVNEYYWVFALPFISIGLGSVSRALHFYVTQDKTGKEVLTFGGVFVIVVLLTTYTLQVYQSSQDERSIERWKYTRDLAQIGREVNQLLPKEEILIAGDDGYYLGMPDRLNYWSSFSFTWNLPKYWPLDPPQAIIVTLGQDNDYSGLAGWLMVNDFQAIECFPILNAHNDAQAAILYTTPTLELTKLQNNCTAEMLAWLEN